MQPTSLPKGNFTHSEPCRTSMPNFAWALLLKPLIALAILVPLRMLVVLLDRRMKDGKLKALLFRRIS